MLLDYLFVKRECRVDRPIVVIFQSSLLGSDSCKLDLNATPTMEAASARTYGLIYSKARVINNTVPLISQTDYTVASVS